MWFFLAGICAVVVTSLIVVNVYEDDIKQYALDQIGKQLKTDIKVQSVHLTLWDQFPSASLQFENVFIAETFEKADTLISASSIFLNFSLSDFISGNYNVNEIAIEDAQVHLKRKKTGEDNYHFWIVSEDGPSEFQIDLNTVSLKNTLVKFDDQQSGLDLKVLATNGDVSGTVASDQLDLSGDIDTQVFFLNVANQGYITDKTVSGNVGLSIDLTKDIYTFSQSNISVNELPLTISGTIDIEPKNTILNLIAKSRKADLSNVVRNLPKFVREKLASFSSSGTFQSEISITGAVSSGHIPTIDASFLVSNGRLKNKNSGITLNNINTNGTYLAQHGKEDLLSFNSLQCSLESGNFNGSGKISRLTNPFINAQIQGAVELEAFQKFFNLPEIDHMAGFAEIAINYKGNFGKGWNPSSSSIRSADISGKCSLEEGSLKLARNPHSISDISGEFLLTRGDAAVNGLMAKVDKSDFLLNGFFRNLIPYLLIENETLSIESTLTSDFLDFNALLSSSSETSSGVDYAMNFPDNINFNLSANIGSLTFRDFNADDIHASAQLSKNQLKIVPISMKTSGGDFQAEIIASQQKTGDFKISSNGDLKNVNITQLFKSFENFQQAFITDQHLKGTATSDFTFSALMSNTLDIQPYSIDVVANVRLNNGELIRHQSLAEMGVYMKEKKLVSALTDMNSFSQKLGHVKFSELTNRIVIKNRQISIPKMEIKSDALDIIAQGTHSFDNSIDYSVGFDLADLTAKRNWTEDEKGLSKYVFVSMTGTTSNPEFGYDQLAVKEQRKENRKEEKQKIKQLLKEEFTKKPSTVDTDVTQQGLKERVTIEWTDTEIKPDVTLDKQEKQTIKKSTFSVEPSSENEDDDDF